jgi:hypothetical protein
MRYQKLFVTNDPVFLKKHHTSGERELKLTKADAVNYHLYTDIKFLSRPKSPRRKLTEGQKKITKNAL